MEPMEDRVRNVSIFIGYGVPERSSPIVSTSGKSS
jgi:hypothetical protein